MAGTNPTSKQEFKRALDKLIVQAYENDIPITNGGYVFRHDSADIPDVEIMIYRLATSGSEGE